MTSAASSSATTFGRAIGTVFRRSADFDGRSSRPEYWWPFLFMALVSSILGALNVATPEGVIGVGSGRASVWAIATLVPSLAVAVRRLRDPGRRWTELFWLLVPMAGLIVIVLRLCEPSKPGDGALAPAEF